MATKIVTKNSSTASAVPTASDLVQGELAVNVADKRLFTEDNAGAIVELGTNPSALTVTGEITANGGIALGDNDKATFGAGDDLQIYHDGEHSYVSDTGIGYLKLKGSNYVQIMDASNAVMANFESGGAVYLSHNGADRFSTTATGIDVTGTATMDGLTVDGAALVRSGNTLTLNRTDNAIGGAMSYVAGTGFIFNDANGDGTSFNVGAANRMRIDSSGNVGIGTSSPGQALAVESSSVGVTRVGITNTGNAAAGAGVHFITKNGATQVSNATLRTDNAGNFSIFSGTTSETERLRIDSSGNLLVGTTDSATTRVSATTGGGHVFQPNDFVVFSRQSTTASQPVVVLNDTGVDGELLQFRKDGSTVGSIGVNAGSIAFGQSNTAIGAFNTDRILFPATASGVVQNAQIDLGYANGRFKDLYLSGTAKSQGVELEDIKAKDTSGLNLQTSNGQKRVILDNSGNLLVGKTSLNVGVTGQELRADGSSYFTSSSDTALGLNRLSSDGTVLEIRKDSAVVGSIGTDAGRFKIKSSSIALYLENESNKQLVWGNVSGVPYFYPQSDNDTNIGYPTQRFKDLYLSGSVGIGASGSVRFNGVGDTTHAVGYDSTVDGSFMRGQNGMRFLTGTGGGSERMRIDSSGNLLVGTSSTADTDVGGKIFNDGRMVQGFAGTGLVDMHDFYRGTAGSLTRVGNIRTNGSSTTYNTSSDQRLKENIADADDAGSKIDAIQVRKYDWKADGSHQDYGMIAQELQAVAPDAVSGDADSEEMMGVDYSKLVPMLVKEIQSLRNRVAQLEE